MLLLSTTHRVSPAVSAMHPFLCVSSPLASCFSHFFSPVLLLALLEFQQSPRSILTSCREGGKSFSFAGFNGHGPFTGNKATIEWVLRSVRTGSRCILALKAMSVPVGGSMNGTQWEIQLVGLFQV